MTVSALVAKSSRMRVILFMTRGAIHGGANKEGVNMTSLTSNSSMLAIQFECEFRMIDIGRLPAGWGMTRRAVGSKLTLVRIILGMTGGAVHWRAFENTIDMTTFTGNCGMFSIKLEGEFRMVNQSRLPRLR